MEGVGFWANGTRARIPVRNWPFCVCESAGSAGRQPRQTLNGPWRPVSDGFHPSPLSGATGQRGKKEEMMAEGPRGTPTWGRPKRPTKSRPCRTSASTCGRSPSSRLTWASLKGGGGTRRIHRHYCREVATWKEKARRRGNELSGAEQ